MEHSSDKYFRRVAKLGSIRRAADELNVAASAISRQIALLEHQLGSPLMVRHPQGIRLTAAGEVFAKYLEANHARYREMLRAMEELSGDDLTTVRVGTAEGVIPEQIPLTTRSFFEAHPRAKVEISVAGSTRVAEMLKNDECDIAIVFNITTEKSHRVEAEFHEPYYAVVSPDHPLSGRTEVDLAQLRPYPILLNDDTYSTTALVKEAMVEQDVELTPKVTINSIEGIRALAKAGVGVGFLPAFTVRKELREKELVCIRLVGQVFEQSKLLILSNSMYPPTQPAAQFIEELITQLNSRYDFSAAGPAAV